MMYTQFSPRKWPGLATQLLAQRPALSQHPDGHPAPLPCAFCLPLPALLQDARSSAGSAGSGHGSHPARSRSAP